MTPVTERQRYLACLSDPSRFSIVTSLASGSRCVTDLASLVGLSQSCTTRHLQALVREGIVSGRRQGKRVMFTLSVSGEELHPVLLWACGPDMAAMFGQRSDEDNGARRTRRKPVTHAASGERAEEGGLKLGSHVEHEGGWVHAHRPEERGDAGAPREESNDNSASIEAPGRVVRSEMDDFLL